MSRNLPRAAALPVALLLLLALAGPVFADARLVGSNPDDKAVLSTPPTVVTLRFDQGLDGGKSSFRLVGPDGEVGTGKPARDGGRVMSLDGLALGAGAYTVKWVVGSRDGHLVRGTVRFTVLEPTQAPETPVPTASADASAGPSSNPSAAATEAPATSAPPAAPTPSAAPSATAEPGTDVDPAASAGSGTDTLIAIVAALALVGGMGAWILRRNRQA